MITSWSGIYARLALTVNERVPVGTIACEVDEVVLYLSESEFTIGFCGSVLSTDIFVPATTLSTLLSRAFCKSVWSERVQVICHHATFESIVVRENSERLGL